jgi:hypothetical protein
MMLNRDSPYDFGSDVNIRAFPVFLQGRHEVQTTTGISGGPNVSWRADLVIFLVI